MNRISGNSGRREENPLQSGRILRSYCRSIGQCVYDGIRPDSESHIDLVNASSNGNSDAKAVSQSTAAAFSKQTWSEASTSKASLAMVNRPSGRARELNAYAATTSHLHVLNNAQTNRTIQQIRHRTPSRSPHTPQQTGPQLREAAQSARLLDSLNSSSALTFRLIMVVLVIVAICALSWIVYDRRELFGSFWSNSIDDFVDLSSWKLSHWTADTSAVELADVAGLPGQQADRLSHSGLQRTVASLKDRVSDLAERLDRCAWADQLAELHSRLVHAEGRLSSLSTKSDHSKLQSLIASQTSIFNARSLKLNSRIERLERLMSSKMGAASTPTFFEADLMPNYALKSDGAELIAENCGGSRSCSLQQRWRQWWRRLPRPDTVLAGGAASGLQPGDCWSFGGFPGRLLIRLSRPIHRVSAVSIDHVSRLLVHKGSVASAPRQFCVFGLAKKCIDSSMRRLGCFTYDAESASLTQTFRVSSAASVTHRDAVSFVLLEVQSNHGHPNFTCVYRFRVHGL